MKKNELKELRTLSAEELTKKEVELRQELFNLQMQRGITQLENPKRLKSVKKDVARIQTILKENQLRELATPANEA